MLSDNDKANRWIDKIAEISDKVAVARKSNVVQTAMATIISVNASDYTVRLLSSPDDGSQDFQAYSKTTEVLHVGDNVFLYYIGDLTNAYIEMLVDGGNVETPYYLPDGGIPESDLSEDVQDKLNTPVNLNILDNGYFLGAGSQAGGTQFPINQRGATSYPGSVYGIDRWFGNNANISTAISSGHVVVSATGAISKDQAIWGQKIENPEKYANRVVTLSLMTYQSADVAFAFNIMTTDSNSTNHWLWFSVPKNDGANLYHQTFTLPSDITAMTIWITPDEAMASGNKIHLSAAKLELGAEQTLAYYDGSNWKLRELPEYTEQLSRCQRYFYRLNRPVATTNTIALAHAYTTSAAVAVLPVPHMRGITSVTTSNAFRLMNNNGTAVNVSSYSPKNSDGGVECSIDITAVSSSLTKGNIYILTTNGAGYMNFNADL